VNELAQFLGYVTKVFSFGRLARSVRCHRPYPTIPTRCLFLSLVLGVVIGAGSYLDISQQTKRRRWQHLIHWNKRISDDAFAYVSERFYLEDLRQNLAQTNQTLKANKALESSKINGPKFNTLLDLEPIRPGEGEAQAALRLLGRIGRVYGVRFFDAVTVDSWYVQGPFLKAVEKLGWEWMVVLKQERMEVFQEARALTANQKPAREFGDSARDRRVTLWEVKDLSFSESYGGKVRVVHSAEHWMEKKVVGGKKISHPQLSHWWWMVSPGLNGYPCPLVYEGGHRRWGLENKAFNELTQFYHLEHCYHHEPIAMLA
jgi:hypothetical protein